MRTVAESATMSDVTRATDADTTDRAHETTAAGRSIVELFQDRVRALSTRTALRRTVDGVWQPLTWGDYGDGVREIAAGLIDLGVAAGDRVALLATNRVEWHLADLGILSTGAVTVPVYPTSAASQVAYIVDHCEARVAFVENREQLAKILEERAALPKLERVVAFSDSTALDDSFLTSLDELRARGRNCWSGIRVSSTIGRARSRSRISPRSSTRAAPRGRPRAP